VTFHSVVYSRYDVPSKTFQIDVSNIVAVEKRFSNGAPQEVVRCAANIMKVYFKN
jgi:hypothetical protein